MDIDDIEGPAMNPGGKSAALATEGLTRKEFEKIVADAFELVPEKFRVKVSSSALRIEEDPSDEALRVSNIPAGHTLFGLYTGVPITPGETAASVEAAPSDTITIFRMPILHAAAHEAGVEVEWGAPTEPMKRRIRTIVRDTIWHEIARHFDMDELEIGAREETETSEFK
ncbi:MAG: metallopeptidase family protein [Patescibacteria group bacterium]